jgi:hypothetical protein
MSTTPENTPESVLPEGTPEAVLPEASPEAVLPQATPEAILPDSVPDASLPTEIPPPPAAAAPADIPPPPGRGPAKAPSKVLQIAKAVIVPLLIVAAFFIWRGQGVGAADVGDCVNIKLGSGNAVESVDTVKCDDANAGYKVVGKVTNISKSDFDGDTTGTTCKDYPSATSWLWEGSDNGYALCLINN